MSKTQEVVLAGLAAEVRGAPGERHPLVLIHGLASDRRQWEPLLGALEAVDPERHVLVIDLPGHGGSARRPSYRLDDVVNQIHEAVTAAGLDAPVLVGHSIGGVIATAYAARHPAAAVVNLDQPLLAGPFRDLLLREEATLRGPAYGEVWARLLESMGVYRLPAAARELISPMESARQDQLLGYWEELMTVPAEEHARSRTAEIEAIRSRGVAYHHVAASELAPAYRNWLETVLPQVDITVLDGGGHFPQLVHAEEVAEIVASL
ncbi:alpha/beta hydrolase [Lentzea sp.]|uniref:alpha/beta fold hydrolase n=1 Tax=Lentzea sp. TaxID=56099 RepID=UPI002C8D6206|nr:alpha/beta hydrolase [Lentzea sp.]HUQ57776.1 alpha/beta hydrolase [Lentzea sp.]